MSQSVSVVGAGLAGAEAASLLARAGIPVVVCEMKPERHSPAHTLDTFAELVCSNSLRSDQLNSAPGVLKAELEICSSFLMAAARQTALSAGRALAVERHEFSKVVTDTLRAASQISVTHQVVTHLPEEAQGPTILATGPLTAEELLEDLVRATDSDALAFYDALAPIIDGDSINMERAFMQSRYEEAGQGDYLNCPMTEEEYLALRQAMLEAEAVPFHDFENGKFFEGCLPIEEMARRGELVMAYGPMKPVGIIDPHTKQQPFAVVQLRREDHHGQSWNMVGFQTRLKQSVQPQVLRLIPGLEHARFLRLGAMHRNAFIDAPRVLGESMQLLSRPWIRVAGQLSGVEGYIESIAHGFLTALFVIAEQKGVNNVAPPAETALGSLLAHVRGTPYVDLKKYRYEPHNINWGLFPPVNKRMPKRKRNEFRAQRALEACKQWWQHIEPQLFADAPLLPLGSPDA